MESLFFLIPVALVFCAVAIRLLLWAIDSGQYDDLDKEGWRVLHDEDEPPTAREHATKASPSDEDAGSSDGDGANR